MRVFGGVGLLLPSAAADAVDGTASVAYGAAAGVRSFENPLVERVHVVVAIPGGEPGR